MARIENDAIDWIGLEREYRAGIKSLRELGTLYGTSEANIRRVAKRDEWVRDLSARIKAETEKIVRKDAMRNSCASKNEERILIQTNAEIQANVIRSHRKSIGKHQELCSKLFEEIREQTFNADDFHLLGMLMYEPDKFGRDPMATAYKKVIDTPARVDSMVKLTNAYKTLVGLERQAFGLSDNSNGEADAPEPITVIKRIIVDPKHEDQSDESITIFK